MLIKMKKELPQAPNPKTLKRNTNPNQHSITGVLIVQVGRRNLQ